MKYLPFLLLCSCATYKAHDVPSVSTSSIAVNVSDSKQYVQAIKTNLAASSTDLDRVDSKASVVKAWLLQN